MVDGILWKCVVRGGHWRIGLTVLSLLFSGPPSPVMQQGQGRPPPVPLRHTSLPLQAP